MRWRKLKNNIEVLKRQRKTPKYTAYLYYKCYCGKKKRSKQTPITKKEYESLVRRLG